MKIKKLTALAMTTAMCAATIFGCGGAGDSDGGKETTGGTSDKPIDVSLKVWTPQEDQDSGWTKQMCEAFAKEHPEWNITFTYETCSEGDAYTNIKTDPTAAGDVFMYANDQLGNLLSIDAIAKLGGSVADYVKETNDEKMVLTVSKDGDIYGIPYTANTWFMYYDKSVFTEDDIKSLDAMLEKAKVAMPLTTGWYFGSYYAAGGAEFSGPNGNDESAGVKAGDKAVEVTKYLVNLVKNENFVNDANQAGLAGLRDGSIKAFFSGSWDYNAAKEALGDNLGIAQLPTIKLESGEGQLKSFAGSKAIGVNPHSKNMEAAVALAQYLASEEAQLKHYEMRNIVPCNTKLLASDAVKNDALAQAQAATVANTSVIQPTDASFGTNFWGTAESMAAEIVSGTVTLDNAAEKTTALENAWNGN